MKTNLSFRNLIVISIFAIYLIGCSKDDEIDSNTDPSISGLIENIKTDSLQSYVQWLQNMGTRFMLADNRKKIALAIQNKFISFGYTNTRIDSFYNSATFKSVPYQTWQYNVIATLSGSISPSSISIMGGHYDNYSKNSDPFVSTPGANDNASGVAATLEVARVIHNSSFTPTATIQFVAFAAEELGLFGSRDYAYKLATSNSTVTMMLNSDMIAYWQGSDPSLWSVNIMDYENSTTLRTDAEKTCSLYTILKTNNNNQYNKQSDSYPFYLNGYKAIFFESNANDIAYHSTSDISSNCNFAFLREVAKVSCAMLVESNK
jgi:bacterial leucyl aminopeptidase